MFRYNYLRAGTVQEVCETLAKEQGKIGIIAGGTDIMVQIREQDQKWKDMDYLLDITSLENELHYIREDEESVYIGALATHTEIEESEIICRELPFLSAACATVGSPQIRNRGTIGGSICNASPAADPLTPLIAAAAWAVIAGPAGVRKILLKNFYLGKGKTDLKTGEFLTGFVIDKLGQTARMEFVKLGRRKALAISRMNVSVILFQDENNIITAARVSPGCIFTVPDRVEAAEQLLTGQKPERGLFQQAGKAVSEEMIKRTGIRWSTEYKQQVIEGLVERSLLYAAGMEE